MNSKPTGKKKKDRNANNQNFFKHIREREFAIVSRKNRQ